MNKYKIGDQFVITLDGINEKAGEPTLYYAKEFGNSIAFNDRSLKKLTKVEKASSDDTGYNIGLREAWELAKKISFELDDDVLEKIFNYADLDMIMHHYSPQEVLNKINDYEKEQNTIHVGDVVQYIRPPYTKLLITSTERALNGIQLINNEYGKKGEAHSVINEEDIEKTGEHIDILNLLNKFEKE